MTMVLRAALAAAALAWLPTVAHADDRFGVMVHGEVALGRNFTPEGGSPETAYVALPTLGIGIGMPGSVQLLLVGTALLGRGMQTSSDGLLGLATRIDKEGVFGKLSILVGPASTATAAGDARHTELVGLDGGFALGLDDDDLEVSAGVRLGDERDDGFVAMATLGVGFGYRLPIGRRPAPAAR